MITIKQIENQMAQAIAKATGAAVEVTNRAQDAWTISGAPNAVKIAADYMVANRLMAVESTVYDDELAESFCYMHS